jgi:hypothetical protein
MLAPMRLLSALVVIAAACQTGGAPPPPPTKADLTRAEAENICNAVDKSGASGEEESNKAYLMAQWLAKEVVSDSGHAWLISFAKLGDDKPARVRALVTMARAAGLPSCPLTAMWQ